MDALDSPAGQALVELFEAARSRAATDGGRAVTVITGAGISTASGIPDYRSPGRAAYRPLQHADYITKPAVRRRYWSRSFIGFPRMATAQPNAGHTALAELEALGFVSHVITQNVDRLHHKAGSARVTELHGTIHSVTCLDCGHQVSRQHLQEAMARRNGMWLHHFSALSSPRPDGDVELPPEAYESFQLPTCDCCRSENLKPDVIFFGGSVPAHVSAEALEAATSAQAVLVVGTTLTTWSGFRLVRDAHAKHAATAAVQTSAPPARAPRIGIINFGETRGDELADFKIAAHTGTVLQAVLARLKAGKGSGPVASTALRAPIAGASVAAA